MLKMLGKTCTADKTQNSSQQCDLPLLFNLLAVCDVRLSAARTDVPKGKPADRASARSTILTQHDINVLNLNRLWISFSTRYLLAGLWVNTKNLAGLWVNQVASLWLNKTNLQIIIDHPVKGMT
ncbi:MAG: hypothetical protein KAI38_04830, partial [Candidatus Latescibacteria bacterium]|nr:hypothetical protein [Candidatus Latescibacterota bacterium]